MKYILLYLLLSGIFLAHYAVAGQAVYGDGIDYWAYLHSWNFDHDVNFTNEYKHLYSRQYNNSHPEIESPQIQKTYTTSIGKTDNPHPAGVALLLFPFYVLADLIVRLLNLFGLHILRNGYSHIYQIVSGLGSILYAVAGSYILEKLILHITSRPRISYLAALSVILCTPLLYYGAYDVLNSHSVSFFVACLFWYLFLSRHNTSPKFYFMLGLITGLAILIRLQEVLLILPVFIHLLFANGHRPKLFIVYISAIILMLIPQSYIWLTLYGLPWPGTYAAHGFLFRGLWGSYFDPLTGLFSRTPLLFLSLFSIPYLLSSKKYILLLIYLLASGLLIIYQGGWRDAAYGGRMYISALPVFSVMLAYLFILLNRRFSPKIISVMVVFFFLLNLISIASFVLFEKQVNSGNTRGLEEHTRDRLFQSLPFSY